MELVNGTSQRRQIVKNFGVPTLPTVTPSQERRWHLSRVEREKSSQATSKATPCRIPEGFWRSAAKLHEARCGMGSRSSHISGGHGATTRPPAVRPMKPRSALTSTFRAAPWPFRLRCHILSRTRQSHRDPAKAKQRSLWLTACRS